MYSGIQEIDFMQFFDVNPAYLKVSADAHIGIDIFEISQENSLCTAHCTFCAAGQIRTCGEDFI